MYAVVLLFHQNLVITGNNNNDNNKKKHTHAQKKRKEKEKKNQNQKSDVRFQNLKAIFPKDFFQ